MNISLHDRVAAVHESGHAVAAYLLSVPFKHVSIFGASSGEGSMTGRLTIREIRETGLQWAHVIVAMLGPATERRVFGRVERSFQHGDAEKIAGLYLTFFKEEMSCQAFRRESRQRTAKIVNDPRFLQGVEALAQSLIEHRTIGEGTALALIRVAIGGV